MSPTLGEDLRFYARTAERVGDPWHDSLAKLLRNAAERHEKLMAAMTEIAMGSRAWTRGEMIDTALTALEEDK